MSDPASALGGASFDGLAAIREIGPLGMVTLRARADLVSLPDAVKAAIGVALPEPRRMAEAGDRSVLWMAPDEWLLLMPYPEAEATVADLNGALAGQHALVANVSDARAVFRVEGAMADRVIAKLCPVDLPMLVDGEVRRTRMAQVACALWRSGPQGITLVTFRSVARYAFDLLANAAR
jgi:sarcosine oxidase, subunit gamma